MECTTSYDPRSCPPPAPERAIPAASGELDNALNQLELRITNLAERLVPALAPQVGSGPTDGEQDSFPCEIASVMSKQSRRVYSCADTIRALLDRLEF